MITRALATQPEKRFQSTAEMKLALEPIRAAAFNRQRLARGRGSKERRFATAERPARRRRANRGKVAGSARWDDGD